MFYYKVLLIDKTQVIFLYTKFTPHALYSIISIISSGKEMRLPVPLHSCEKES